MYGPACALRSVSCRYRIRLILPVTHFWRDEHPVRFLAVESNGCADGTCQAVVAISFWALSGTTRWGLGEVITATRLVVDDGDQAGRAGAEGVLGSGIGDTTGGQWAVYSISESAVREPKK